MNIETKFGLFPRDHGGTRYATARRALMQPHRRYHGITHIHRCLSYVEDRFLVDDNINCIESLVDACVFHDIVYDSRPDKEFRSAIAYSCLVKTLGAWPNDALLCQQIFPYLRPIVTGKHTHLLAIRCS